MEERISVIVPVYNAEKTLARCIEALLGQTYGNIELLLVDDGSKDGSLAICREYAEKDNRITVIHKENGGVSSARNAGLDAATGAYIMFCDSDDWVEEDWCRQLLKHYEPDSLVMCCYYIEDGPKMFSSNLNPEISPIRYPRSKFYDLKMKGMFAPWNKIFSRKVIKKYSIRFKEDITNGEDMLFNIEYLFYISGPIIQIPYKGIHYTWPREGSLSKAVPSNYFEQLVALHGCLRKKFFSLGISGKDQWHKIYTDFYNEYQKGLLALMKSKKVRLLQKIKIANSVMRYKDYQICAKNAKISSNKIFSAVCRSKNCFGFWIFSYFIN